MQAVCCRCSREFQTEYPDAKYCSRLCKDRARRIRQGVKPHPTRGWLAGRKFGRLTLVEKVSVNNCPDGRQAWVCNCDCGSQNFIARSDKILDGRKQSCGCLKRELADAHTKLVSKGKSGRIQSTVSRFAEQQKALDEIKEKEAQWTPKDRSKCPSRKAIEKKHDALKGILFYSGTPRADPLWSLRYYTELIRDNECHYCGGAIEDEKHSLDFFGDVFVVQAHEVVPSCQACISRRMSHPQPLSFEEMGFLIPGLNLIRLQKRKDECNCDD